MTTIFAHYACISYFQSPLHLYQHLWSVHPDLTLAVQIALDQSGLNILVIRQEIHTAYQPGAKGVYLFSTCETIFETSFAVQAHLQEPSNMTPKSSMLGGSLDTQVLSNW